MKRSKINNVLEILFGGSKKLVAIWWGTPNKAFFHKTPDEMYNENPEIVSDYVLRFFP